MMTMTIVEPDRGSTTDLQDRQVQSALELERRAENIRINELMS